MRPPLACPVRLKFILLAFILLVAQTAAGRQAAGNQAVVFAVRKFETGVQLEPVVMLNRGRFDQPPVEGSDAPEGSTPDAPFQKFVKDYFRPGRQYRMLFGGGEAGTVTVVKYLEPGCVGLVAEATAETQVRLGGEVHALATDAAALGRQPTSRRAPTEAERASALELARAAYARNAVGPALVKEMRVQNLTASDLDRDGQFELVGSFLIMDAKYNAFALFMIFEPAGGKLRAGMTWFHKGAEATHEERRLVDLLDLDGDGVSEVIAGGFYYESNDYVIYKRQQGRWRAVYQGGGGGC